MKNYKFPGKIIPVTLGTGVTITSGSPFKVGILVGVSSMDADGDATTDEGKSAPLHMEGVFELNKVNPMVIAQGVKVYWDDTAKLVTTTASGNTAFGHAYAAAGSTDATVLVRLMQF